ncbi:hypothetical protein HAX54_035253 [Datura stramonium]|uniref:Uncharacterized protein n=1 Tax=Datura stramonium TaxID=4076 RepID=A0ABS8Y5W3_DATST|nr:hypothetical protein [Datura stramonium]
MREPRYPLLRVIFVSKEAQALPPQMGRVRQAIDLVFLGTFCAEYRREMHEGGPKHPARAAPQVFKQVSGSFCFAGFDNDPSAGSPMETLLQLILPLTDKVQWTSRDVAGRELPTSL